MPEGTDKGDAGMVNKEEVLAMLRANAKAREGTNEYISVEELLRRPYRVELVVYPYSNLIAINGIMTTRDKLLERI